MTTALAILMGALALAALAFWILAIRLSYRVERLRKPDLPKPRLVYTNIFATAFWPGANAGAEEKKLQPQLRLRLIAALGCLLTMAIVSFALPLMAQEDKLIATSSGPAITWEHDPGTTLSYVRSNQNGSKPERILVHVAAPDELHVAKMVAPCTDAAYVTAKFFRPGDAVSQLVGGRLQRDSSQLPQAWLDAQAPGELLVRLGDPAAKPAETHAMPIKPWRMYDFDLAEFALHGPRNKTDFTFGLAMAWPDTAPPLVQILGQANAKFLYTSDKGTKNHFRISGPAFTDPVLGDRGGEIITDSKYGHVIEARLGRPNHSGYDNFLLRLTAVATGAEGEAAWKNALAAHWANCPAE